MPKREICPKTGAILYTPTEEEAKIRAMEKDIEELKQLLKAKNSEE